MELNQEYAGTYQNLQRVGAGSGGTIYRAYHTRLKKEVALKQINDVMPGKIDDLRREVDILKNLRHSYLPQVLDYIETNEGVYTVMDFIAGKSLQDMLKEGYRFSERKLLSMEHNYVKH